MNDLEGRERLESDRQAESLAVRWAQDKGERVILCSVHDLLRLISRHTIYQQQPESSGAERWGMS